MTARRSAYVVALTSFGPEGSVLAVRPWHQTDGWSLPGGGVEPGESFAEAAQRELFEETGLLAARLEPIARVETGGPDRLIEYFWAAGLYGAPRSSHEGEADWVALHNLCRGPHADTDTQVVAWARVLSDHGTRIALPAVDT